MTTTMRILYHNEGEDPALWLPHLSAALPEADIREWVEGDTAPADYALVWKPPAALLAGRTDLKAIFNLAAGVDSLLQMGDLLPQNVPVFRLEDAGMAIQIAEYATHTVLRYFRRFDEYEILAKNREWKILDSYERQDFTIGIMGSGVMGTAVAEQLRHFHFPVNTWSQHKKEFPGIRCFAGDSELNAFLNETSVLICLLPLTAKTGGILNRDHFKQLKRGAFLINLGRGAHLNEMDLLEALESGQITAATLDVFNEEPLPSSHAYWNHPRITMTPHIGAFTFHDSTIEQIATKVRAFERGEIVSGSVNRERGY